MTAPSGSGMTGLPDITGLHRGALDATRTIVAEIPIDAWHAPTPCHEWDVRGLLNHVVSGNLWASRLGAGATIDDVGTALDGDQLGDDPLAAYDRSADAAARAFEAPGALDAPCAVSYGPVPGSIYAGHRFLDVLIHGWDLAVAIDRRPALTPDLVAGAWNVLEPQLAALRTSGMFGPLLEIPDDAEPTTRLLMTLGRMP